MAAMDAATPKLPPAWFIHLVWHLHRVRHRMSGGRFLWAPASKRGSGVMRLTATGRRSSRQRVVIVGCLEDRPDLVVLAMNGWDEGHPVWWQNLQAHPECQVRRPGRREQAMRPRAAGGEERDRLWERSRTVDTDLDGYAARRTTVTPVVVFEP